MQIDKVVINASPLILLFKSGLADLLPQMFSEIVVPDAVWNEVLADKLDAAATQLPSVSWVNRVTIEISPGVLIWNLGDGESEVLSYALKETGYRAMIDDRAARRCAQTFGIKTLGTGGVLVLAKKRGLITSVTDELKKVQDAGLWLSDEIVALLKEQAGEVD
jgi:predicted nucleic acid-binding protein